MSTRLAPAEGLAFLGCTEVPCYRPAVADDDRTRRRLGDETKSRIADLASGWSVDSPPSEPAAAPDVTEPPRKKQRTIPPPAPGSSERQAFEQTIVVASVADRDDATD